MDETLTPAVLQELKRLFGEALVETRKNDYVIHTRRYTFADHTEKHGGGNTDDRPDREQVRKTAMEPFERLCRMLSTANAPGTTFEIRPAQQKDTIEYTVTFGKQYLNKPKILALLKSLSAEEDLGLEPALDTSHTPEPNAKEERVLFHLSGISGGRRGVGASWKIAGEGDDRIAITAQPVVDPATVVKALSAHLETDEITQRAGHVVISLGFLTRMSPRILSDKLRELDLSQHLRPAADAHAASR